MRSRVTVSRERAYTLVVGTVLTLVGCWLLWEMHDDFGLVFTGFVSLPFVGVGLHYLMGESPF
ncbi:hypothetical protein [Halorientalis marina]|uniref:hypothetical protein n=1 Tax=Halorientalis marina TaxID=2931976 RepID=UPI001FF41B89|nr:hypothetical protein [Halorientalis marina]